MAGGGVEVGDGENGFEAGIAVVNFGVGGDDFSAESFVGRAGDGLELEGVEPFVVFAVGLEAGGEQAGEFGGLPGLAGVGEFFDEDEEEVGAVREFFREIEPEGFGVVEFTLGEEVFERFVWLMCRRH